MRWGFTLKFIKMYQKLEFYEKLIVYYQALAKELQSELGRSAAFDNPTDKGVQREEAYMRILKRHTPLACRMFLGGYVFGIDGLRSSQLDILVVADSVPTFGYAIENQKGFASIEGTLAVFSIKSFLDSTSLVDCLQSFALLPTNRPLTEAALLGNQQPQNYDDWPLKVIFACDGISKDSLEATTRKFYEDNPTIPYFKRVSIIHVLSKAFAQRPVLSNAAIDDFLEIGMPVDELRNDIIWYGNDPDVLGFGITFYNLQQLVVASRSVFFRLEEFMRNILFHIPPLDESAA